LIVCPVSASAAAVERRMRWGSTRLFLVVVVVVVVAREIWLITSLLPILELIECCNGVRSTFPDPRILDIE